MDIKQLEYFVYIADTLNFSSAASKFHTTQPTISRQIANLEKELDAPLFTRSSHNVQLTPEGSLFYPYALAIINSKSEGLAILQQSQNKKSTRKIRCLLPSELDSHFTACAENFLVKHPNIELSADRIRHTLIEQVITNNAADVFFLRDNTSICKFPQYTTENLFEDHFALLIRKKDIEKFQKAGFSALHNTPFGIPNPFSLRAQYNRTKSILENMGITPQIVKTYEHLTALVMASRSNLINCIIPMGLATNITESLVVPLTSDESKIQYYISYLKGKSATVDSFVADCINHFNGKADNKNSSHAGIIWKTKHSDNTKKQRLEDLF